MSNFLKSYGTQIIDPEKKKDTRRQSVLSGERSVGSITRVGSQGRVLPKEVSEVLDATALEFTFDIFNFNKIVPGHELSSLMYYFFDKFTLFENLEINVSTFSKFAQKIHEGYAFMYRNIALIFSR